MPPRCDRSLGLCWYPAPESNRKAARRRRSGGPPRRVLVSPEGLEPPGLPVRSRMLCPLSYGDSSLVPRPGIEPGERRLEGAAVVLHPRLALSLLVPRQRVERCVTGIGVQYLGPPGGASWSRQRELHSRYARTGRGSWLLNDDGILVGGANRT